MSTPEQFQDYARLVSSQLRWAQARPQVEREMLTHLCDQREALIRAGLEPEAATAESLRQSGDPVTIGGELDRVHRPRTPWSLFVLTGVLLLAGLALRLWLGFSYEEMGLTPIVVAGSRPMASTVIALLLGGGCLLGAYFLDFSLIGRHPLLVYLGLLLLALVPNFGLISGFGHSLLYSPPLYPLAYAALLYYLRGRGYLGVCLALLGMLPPLACSLLVAPAAGLALFCPAALVLLLTAVAKGWFGVNRWRSLALVAAAALAGAALMACYLLTWPYIWERIIVAAFLPQLYPWNEGFLALTIRDLIAGAQWLGPSQWPVSAASAVAYYFDSELMLTWLIHSRGWLVFALLMAVFAAFFYCGFRLCGRQRNILGLLTSLSVLLGLALQTLFYVSANLGWPLVNSFALPLVSDGNNALVVNMALIGVMLSAFRSGSLVKDSHLPCPADRWRVRLMIEKAPKQSS